MKIEIVARLTGKIEVGHACPDCGEIQATAHAQRHAIGCEFRSFQVAPPLLFCARIYWAVRRAARTAYRTARGYGKPIAVRLAIMDGVNPRVAMAAYERARGLP